MKFIIRWVPFFVVLAVLSIGMALPVAGQTPDDTRVYLPFAGRAMLTGPVFTILSGRYPADYDATFTLDFFDGISVTEVMSTTRGSAGWFIFDKLPLLEAGQYYQVSYYNGRYGPPDENNATIAKGPKITTSEAGGFRDGGFVFYKDGFTLSAPSDGRQYAYSHPLEWHQFGQRNYVTIYDLQGNELYKSEPSSNGQAYFSPLPSGLSFNTPYIWQVSMENENGSVLINNKSRREVTFVAEEPLPAPVNLGNECHNPPLSSLIFCDFFWDSVGENVEYSIYGHTWSTDIRQIMGIGCHSTFTWWVKARTETAESWRSIPKSFYPKCYP
jgi:hypothetical protein